MKRIIAALLISLLPSLAAAQAVVVPSPVPSCANNDVLKWNTATSLFICASAAATSQPLSDVSGLIANSADPTKILKFDVSGIATATTRTWTIPNANITVPTTIASLAGNTFTGSQVMNGGFTSTTGTLSSTFSVAGATTFNTVAYTWPGSQGASNTFLKNDGSGGLTWGTQSAAVPNPITQDLLFTDATYDIGKSAATRPRDEFLSRNLTVGGTLGVTGASTITSLSATSGAFSTTLSVTGASTLAAVAATTGTFSSIVTITGNLTLSGTGNAVGTITSGTWNGGPVFKVVTITDTGTQNNYAPGVVGNTILRCNNASLLTITGIAGGVEGSRLIVVSIGAGQVEFTHQDTNSTSTNRLINFTTTGTTPLGTGVGLAEYIYDSTSGGRWRLINHDSGWIFPAFSAGDYTPDSGTWTVGSGDVVNYAYRLNNATMTVVSELQSTTVASNPSILNVKIPGGKAATAQGSFSYFYSDNGTFGTGLAQVSAAGTNVRCFTATLGTWAAATDNSFVRFTISFKVN